MEPEEERGERNPFPVTSIPSGGIRSVWFSQIVSAFLKVKANLGVHSVLAHRGFPLFCLYSEVFLVWLLFFTVLPWTHHPSEHAVCIAEDFRTFLMQMGHKSTHDSSFLLLRIWCTHPTRYISFHSCCVFAWSEVGLTDSSSGSLLYCLIVP